MILMKRGRRMNQEVRRIVENRKGRQIGRVIESDRKRGNYCTEFPESGNTIYTERTPQHPNGVDVLVDITLLKTFIYS